MAVAKTQIPGPATPSGLDNVPSGGFHQFIAKLSKVIAGMIIATDFHMRRCPRRFHPTLKPHNARIEKGTRPMIHPHPAPIVMIRI